MFSHLRLGALAVICLFALASVAPADAQHRRGSSSGTRTGATAAPRPAQGPGPSAGPRPSQGQQGRGVAARPPQGQPTGSHAVPRPGGRPGYGNGGYYPGHGNGGYYPGRGYRGYYPGYGYRGYYPWYGGYYSNFYWGFGAYLGPYYYSPWLYSSYWYYPYYAPYDYGYGYGYGSASLKVEVKPKNAEVYVDGHLAGIVDQFDGMFQSLSVEPGGHEITVYLDGFRPIHQQLYLSAGSTQRIKGTLEPLAPGEANEPRPQAAPPQQEPQVQVAPQYRGPEPQYRSPEPQQAPPPERQAPEQYPPVAGDARFGQVAIRVQPGDAEVRIDGEAWRNPEGADRLVVHLAPGTHRVEIRKDGYDSFVTAIEVRRGETTALNVSLSRF